MSSEQTEGRKPEFVADYLLYLLAAASDGASAQFHAEVRKAGLRVPEWRVLACLYDRDGSMITQLARIALVEQSRLTRIIAGMEEKGLVRRQSDPNDGRRVRIFVTPQGRDITGLLVPKARQHEANLLEHLAKEGHENLKPVLTALLNIVETEPPRLP